jgi:dihydrofolate reductase
MNSIFYIMMSSQTSAIVALDSMGGYSKGGLIPWHKKDISDLTRHERQADMKWFVNMTSNSTMVMGGQTYRSLPKYFDLSNRSIIVLTRDEEMFKQNDTITNVSFINNVDELLDTIKNIDNVWICGAYETLAPYIGSLYISRISGNFNCDTIFPFNLLSSSCMIFENVCTF